jgi:hypothetical protein
MNIPIETHIFLLLVPLLFVAVAVLAFIFSGGRSHGR